MRHVARTRAFRYSLAVVTVGAVLLVRSRATHLFGPDAPFLLFTGAVMITAWAAGLGPGLVATALSAAASLSDALASGQVSPRLSTNLTGLFVMEGLLVSALSSLRGRAENNARRRADQHAAVAELGRLTLEGYDLRSLMERAVTLTTETLQLEYGEIVEHRPGGKSVRIRAGDGFDEEAVQSALAELEPETGTALTLLTEALIVVKGFGPEKRFKRAKTAEKQDVVSGVRVTIPGAEHPFGTLGAYTRQRRRFTRGDIDFLQSVANLLASANRRRLNEEYVKRARERGELLAEVSMALSSSLGYATRIQEMAGLVVPRFADWCVVDMVEENGQLKRTTVVQADPSRAPLARQVKEQDAIHVSDQHPVFQAWKTGRSQLIETVSEEQLRRLARDDEHLATLRRIGLRSLMAVPLEARGRILGVISFGSAESGREYGRNDLVLAEELAGRAALAIDNARLFVEVIQDDRRKDEFLAMLSHELRNPLAAMVNALEVMRLAGEDSQALERGIRVMSRQADHMGRLVKDLLEISRITRGTIDLHREPVQLAQAIAHAVETSWSLIEKRHHHLTVSPVPQEVWLDADPVRLEQILVNLINNAAVYSEPGGRIDLLVTQEDRKVEIRVRDTGVGIPGEMLPLVFELFAKGGPTQKESRSGMGIGLYLVRQLVELHGGSVEATSGGVGKGSEFVVRLPVRAAPARVETVAPPAPPSRTMTDKRLRVLVVDDDADSSAPMAELLSLWGHVSRTAQSGPEAIKTAQAFHPDVVLLDLGLPGMDGYQVARELRRCPELSGTRLVALTGYGRDQDRERSREAGIHVHLTKPADLTVLRKLLTELADSRPALQT